MRTGLHCNGVHDPALIIDYYRRSGAKVAKFMTYDGALFNTLKGMGVTLIGRVFTDNQQLGGAAAREHTSEVLARAREYPQVDYWEGFNEFATDADELGRYAEHEIARMKAFDDAHLGARCLILNASCGKPALPDDPNEHERTAWPNFRPALEYALPRGHALGLHEYSGPFMQWLCGGNQWDWGASQPARIDDPCADQRVEGWLTLRYRKLWRMCMVPWGLAALPLFITEGGIDNVWPRPGGQGNGYQDFADTEWARIPGIGDYAQQRRWYMWQVSHDAQVRGVVDFGFETEDPQWKKFDMATDPAMRSRVIALEADLPIGHHGDVAIPPPPPAPEVRMIAGVDVSKYQQGMDWPKCADTEVDFAFVRAGVGVAYVDPFFNSNARGAPASGLITSPYHYWIHSHDPEAQARFFFGLAKDRGLGRPACDFEETDNPAPIDAGRVKAYLEAVTALFGIRPFVYTSAGWWNKFVGLQSWAAEYPLWIASWTSLAQPTLPRGWTKWAVWQHGGGNGVKYGAQSSIIDMNRFAGTADQLRALFAMPAPPPVTPHVPAEPNMGKIVWFLEDAQRRCEAEGLLAESKYIGDRYTSDAKARRG